MLDVNIVPSVRSTEHSRRRRFRPSKWKATNDYAGALDAALVDKCPIGIRGIEEALVEVADMEARTRKKIGGQYSEEDWRSVLE